MTHNDYSDDVTIQPVYGADGTTSPSYLDDLSAAKRLADWMTFVPTPDRQAGQTAAARFAGSDVDLSNPHLRPLWDSTWSGEGAAPPLVITRHEARIAERRWRVHLARRAATAITDPTFAIWRRRQLLRLGNEIGPHHSERQALHPVAFELQSGCSVGCWFCGVSAPPLTRLWRYTDQTGRFWRAVLQLFRERLGPATAHGFCYWASDPLDNPDYERFAEDFRSVLGRYPQMTTAIALRDPARTARILDAAWASEREVHRISVMGMGQFRRIMRTFTPRQMLLVDLVPLHGPGMTGKVAAGRARQRTVAASDVAASDAGGGAATHDQATIACLGGFLLNMAEGTIRLVVPCRPDDRHPDGVRTITRDVFTDPASLATVVDRMIRMSMPIRLPPDLPVRLLDRITAHAGDGAVALASPWRRTVFPIDDRRPDDRPALWAGAADVMARLLSEGRHLPHAITTALAEVTGMPVEAADRWLDQMFAAGFLDEYADWF